MAFSKTFLHDYDQLYSLDFLGSKERRDDDDDNYFYEEFQRSWGVDLGNSMK